MSRPYHEVSSDGHIGPGLEAPQPSSFDQFIAELAGSKSGLVVAEMRSGGHSKARIGKARTVAVTLLEAEIDHPTDDQVNKVQVRKCCRRQDLGQNIHCRERSRIAH